MNKAQKLEFLASLAPCCFIIEESFELSTHCQEKILALGGEWAAGQTDAMPYRPKIIVLLPASSSARMDNGLPRMVPYMICGYVENYPVRSIDELTPPPTKRRTTKVNTKSKASPVVKAAKVKATKVAKKVAAKKPVKGTIVTVAQQYGAARPKNHFSDKNSGYSNCGDLLMSLGVLRKRSTDVTKASLCAKCVKASKITARTK